MELGSEILFPVFFHFLGAFAVKFLFLFSSELSLEPH
jgi:hypothetical protein